MRAFDKNISRWVTDLPEPKCNDCSQYLQAGDDAYYCFELDRVWCVDCFKMLKYMKRIECV